MDAELVADAHEGASCLLVALCADGIGGALSERGARVGDVVLETVAGEASGGTVP